MVARIHTILAYHGMVLEYHGTMVPLGTMVHVYQIVVLEYPWNPQTRTTTETVLREAMQALGRVQANMLARIVVEIRAADIAVELEPQL